MEYQYVSTSSDTAEEISRIYPRLRVLKNVIEMKQEGNFQPNFHQDELITWHDYQGQKCIPIPGVVLLQDNESVLIRARVEGLTREVRVSPKLLVHR